jgi:hypothetical protein
MNNDFTTFELFAVSGLGSNPETLEIFISFTHTGFFQSFISFHLCANVMKAFIIGHAHSRPFHL